MRKRLAQFGIQDNQIQQGLTPHNQLRLAPQPTYAKVHRTYLDVETLHYYNIPYEYDSVGRLTFVLAGHRMLI